MEYAFTVTDALLSEGQGSSANHVNTGFKQNSKALMTRSIKTCGKIYGSGPLNR